METWIKSSYCAADKPQCVEVRLTAKNTVEVRDSKWTGTGTGPFLTFTRTEWDAFTNGVKAGEFDLS